MKIPKISNMFTIMTQESINLARLQNKIQRETIELKTKLLYINIERCKTFALEFNLFSLCDTKKIKPNNIRNELLSRAIKHKKIIELSGAINYFRQIESIFTKPEISAYSELIEKTAEEKKKKYNILKKNLKYILCMMNGALAATLGFYHCPFYISMPIIIITTTITFPFTFSHFLEIKKIKEWIKK